MDEMDEAPQAPGRPDRSRPRPVAAGRPASRHGLVRPATRARWRRTWRSRFAAAAAAVVGIVGGASILATTHRAPAAGAAEVEADDGATAPAAAVPGTSAATSQSGSTPATPSPSRSTPARVTTRTRGS